MMNLGRGYPTPQQNGVVQNVDSWIPLTPQKPILPRSGAIPAEMQGNLAGRSNWQDLVGIYSGLLQENTNNSGLLEDILPSGLANPVVGEHVTQNAAIIKNRESFNFGGVAAPVENRERFILGAGNNARNAPVIENSRRFNFGAGSYVQKLGINPEWYRNSPPQLPAARNTSYAPFPNGTPNWHAPLSQSSSGRLDRNTLVAPSPNGTPDRSIYVSNISQSPCTWSQLEGICSEYKSPTSMLTKRNNLRTSDDNLSQAHRDGFPVPYWPTYDLNSSPRSEGGVASSTTSCFKFAPLTPDQGRQLKDQQLSGISNSLIDEGLSQRKDKLENLVSVEEENVECHSAEFVQNLMDSSFVDIAASLENQAYVEGDQGGIDLNKIPKQKPPRRRKHRPKVVVEGKPKRTPKATTPRNNSSPKNPPGKRKYVRRKGLGTSATEQCDVINEIKTPNDRSQTKSCRRVLNFDLENQAGHEIQERIDSSQAERNEENKEHFNLNFIFPDAECSGKINKVHTKSALNTEKLCGYGAEKHHEGSKITLTYLTNQMSSGASLSVVPAADKVTANNRAINVIARNLSMRNVNLNQPNSQSGCNQGHQDILGGLGHTTQANIDRTRQLLLQRTQVLRDVSGLIEQRGFKRAHCQTSVLPYQQIDTSMCSQLLPQGIATKDESYARSSNLHLGAAETCKKNKVSDISQRTTSFSCCIPTTQGSLRQMDTRVMNGVCTSSSISHLTGQSTGYNLEKQSPPRNLNSGYQIPANQYVNHMAIRHDFLEQQTSSEVQSQKEQIANKMSKLNSHIHRNNSLIAFANWNMQSPNYTASRSAEDREIEVSCSNMPTKKTRGPARSTQPLSKDRVLSQYQSSSTKAKAAGTASLGPEKVLDLLDQITHKLRGLYISDYGKEIAEKAETALVQYKGDGSIVPYEGFDPIKRRKPRPKVDLDPQTNKLWNLLMGKEGSKSTETMDKHTEKWWEEERNVFQGRVDSFIARMHLVQGDRRFSPWKGSVVDSVIGVFLTQNVSDHLSSSAFMSLAAKFPPHPTKQASWWNKANPIVEEPIQIIDPDGTITYHASITRQPVYYQSSTTSSETSEQRIEDLRTVTRASTENKNKRTKDDAISSQTSPDSYIYQTLDEVRSSSGSNSEAEDQIILCHSHKNKTSEKDSLQRERTPMLQEYQNHMIQNSFIGNMAEVMYQQPEHLSHYGHNPSQNTGLDTCAYSSKTSMQQVQGCIGSSNHWSTMKSDLGLLAENCFELPVKRGISSLGSVGSNISMVAGIDHPNRHIGGMAGSDNELTAQLRETQLAFLDTHLKPISRLQSVPNSGCNQSSMHNNPKKSSKTIQLESTNRSEPARPAEELPKCQIGETTTFNKPTGGTDANNSNKRKRNAEGGKSRAFDWDSLRKQVLSNDSRKARSKDAMDSMDYKALRHADVKEISDAIKERGMNNMLAERIKDFLNRLVQEHERIDLEWLRDVPPDKAKDYLLSIRGLGLKSVECVRLLTLHHVAFPVDTNVGRIAVRLGWVPLQPLPESLQLHLLEMYPVLESIQKYLWPRLCQLDQRTLYELHYQMITFGKVFCTKSKPNCNACPMRGDCRHFASAFASARLALPGPEESSIVNSVAPIAVDEIPAPVIKAMPLPLTDTNLVKETGVVNCSTEPLVQEPPSPELPTEITEITESDIEDAFYNDPDEIPTIKLNIEEFTTNLQSFMQENMEMQEGDLSRAIVALNPEVASLPTPKLKNVSRLRTEHQVYELPDSHPILKGLDRREPDDPSPYLLAIWTPGETANSIQPPESKCNNQASGTLCYENTCFACNSIKEANSQTVRGTLLIPCRTAMRGSFPLNGTYFQVNEVFADHESSLNPIDVPRASIWNLPRRTVYFGTSCSTIFRGLTTEGIQFCFWRGFVCVRGFDQKTRAPRPLIARLHFPASKMVKVGKEKEKDGQAAERTRSQRTS